MKNTRAPGNPRRAADYCRVSSKRQAADNKHSSPRKNTSAGSTLRRCKTLSLMNGTSAMTQRVRATQTPATNSTTCWRLPRGANSTCSWLTLWTA